MYRHMFMFALHDPRVVYTAEETGQMHRVDLRSRHVDMIFENKPMRARYDNSRENLPLKYIIQHPNVGEYCIIYSNEKTQVNSMELRFSKHSTDQFATIRAWDSYERPRYKDLSNDAEDRHAHYEGHSAVLK